MTDTLRPAEDLAPLASAERASEGTGSEPPPRRRRPRRGWLTARARSALPGMVTFGAFIGVWEFASTELMSRSRRFLLPTPATVLSRGLLDSKAVHQLGISLWLTTRLALFGLAMAIVLGLLLGVVMYRFGVAERASYPYLVALQAVPVLAIAPLMTVLFGYSFWAKSIIVVIIAFFPIPTTLLLGMKSVDNEMLDLFELAGASWWARVRKLALPNALPSLFTGLQISAGLSVIGAIVGELFFQQGTPGLGQLINAYQTNMEYPQMYGAIIVSSLLGIAIFSVFGWVGRRAIGSWHESAASALASGSPKER